MSTRSTSAWRVPAFSVALGGVMFAALAINDKPWGGVFLAAIMVAYAGVLLLGGRSQVVRVLRGQRDDERLELVDVRANAFAGHVLTGVVLLGFFQALFRDVDAWPYNALAAVAAVAYLTGLGWYRWRT